jgi:hypothetical protein
MFQMAKLAVIVALLGCGTSAKSAGEQCTQSSDCESSLDCLDVGQFSGSTCTVVGKVCTLACTGASDPAFQTLGSSFQCLAGCGSDPMICAEVSGP